MVTRNNPQQKILDVLNKIRPPASLDSRKICTDVTEVLLSFVALQYSSPNCVHVLKSLHTVLGNLVWLRNQFVMSPNCRVLALQFPLPLKSGMARTSQPHRITANLSAAVTRDYPTDRRGAGQRDKRQRTPEHAQHAAVRKGVTRHRKTSKNNIEPQTNVARQSPEYSHL